MKDRVSVDCLEQRPPRCREFAVLALYTLARAQTFDFGRSEVQAQCTTVL